MPTAGMRIHRTYGTIDTGYGVQRGSGPWGESWTHQPFEGLDNVRDELGLPPFNGGRFTLSGALDDPASVSEIRRALVLVTHQKSVTIYDRKCCEAEDDRQANGSHDSDAAFAITAKRIEITQDNFN